MLPDRVTEGGFKDFGGATVGFGFQSSGRTCSVGAFYTSSTRRRAGDTGPSHAVAS